MVKARIIKDAFSNRVCDHGARLTTEGQDDGGLNRLNDGRGGFAVRIARRDGCAINRHDGQGIFEYFMCLRSGCDGLRCGHANFAASIRQAINAPDDKKRTIFRAQALPRFDGNLRPDTGRVAHGDGERRCRLRHGFIGFRLWQRGADHVSNAWSFAQAADQSSGLRLPDGLECLRPVHYDRKPSKP